jgi:hypothetical protein
MAGIKEPICLLVAIDQLVRISVQRNATQRNATLSCHIQIVAFDIYWWAGHSKGKRQGT